MKSSFLGPQIASNTIIVLFARFTRINKNYK